jgi:sulfite exporter TauE/SafE
MCGGIVGMLGVRQAAGARGWAAIAAAHLGRVATYSAIGALVGFAGAAALGGLLGARGLLALRVVAAVLVIVIGCQLLLGRPLLGAFERGGAKIWRRIAPLLRGLLPPRDPVRALAVGALWGWLPCGLVYSELAVAASSGGPAAGALVMASFGLGTVLSLSVVSTLLHSLGLGRMPRQVSGAVLVLFGVWIVLPVVVPHAVLGHVEAAAAIAEHAHHGH